jgi:hypothetical protein
MASASPDLLWMTGFSLSGRYLEASSAMVVERVAPLESIAAEDSELTAEDSVAPASQVF